jgi:hypothetical protein
MNYGQQTQRTESEENFQKQTDRNASDQMSRLSLNNQSNATAKNSRDYVELKYRQPGNVATEKLARGLGIFSLALGLAEVLAPARVGELIGVGPRHQALLPILGIREIAHGLGILSQPKPTEAVWTRIGGDAIDLAYLGWAFMSPETNKKRLTGATIVVLGVAALDAYCAQQLSSQEWSDSDGNPQAPTTVGQSSARQSANL